MLTAFFVALFQVAFCTGYVLLLIYVGPYLAVMDYFSLPDPVNAFWGWLIQEISEIERSEHDEQ